MSGASLGLGPASEVSNPSGFDVPATDRYEDAGLLGRGGMGEVRAARDRRLERVVAVKTAVRSDTNASRRLWKEAALTARLTHPGIVPIHDAGRDRDGRAFYTMPVVKGRTLADAAANASLEERLRLVRPILDACRAVAYAHAQGVLHRDLKPANILVGSFGETQVVDWGLAAPIGDTAQTSDGTVVGTPAYMAPEQGRGEALSRAADVYGLGATLHEVLSGRTPVGKKLRDLAPAVPAELAAIVDRALAFAPLERYPDAQALTEDLEAWFEGRQVAAHSYSAWDLLRRFLQAWRIPLVAAGLATAAIVVMAVVFVQQTRTERDRAREAEREAVEIRKRAESSLAMAQVAQAVDAVSRGDQAAAEVLAATALTWGESPDARGVLTHFDPAARPRRSHHWAMPGCKDVDLSDGGLVVACVDDSSVVTWRAGERLEELGRFPMRTDVVAVASEGPTVLVRELGDLHTVRDVHGSVLLQIESKNAGGVDDVLRPDLLSYHTGGGTTRVDVHARRMWRDQTCTGFSVPGIPVPRFNGSAISRGERVVNGCNDTQVVVSTVGEDTPPRIIGTTDRSAGVISRLGISPDGRIGAIVTTKGLLSVYDLDAGQLIRSFPPELERAGAVAVSGTRVAVAGLLAVTVLDFRSGLPIARIPVGEADIAWLDAGTTLRVAADAVEDWVLPETPPRPTRHVLGTGISAIALSPDGTHLAVGDGDGVVTILDVLGASPPLRVPLDTSVVKDVAWSPDGRRIAAICAIPKAIFLLDAQEPARMERLDAPASRRLAWLPSGLLALGSYASGLHAWPDLGTEERSFPAIGQTVDMEPDSDGAGVTLLGASGVVWRLRDGPVLEPTSLPSDGVESVVAGGKQVYGSFGSQVRSLTVGTEPRRVDLPGGWVTELALSPDGRLLAAGQLDGSIRLVETETFAVRAVLKGHGARMSALSFDGAGDWLLSAGWDGEVRAWSLVSLYTDAATLRGEAEATWGRNWEDVIPG